MVKSMARKAPELGPLAVSRLKEPGLYAVGGVSGLYLQVLPSGGRSWVLRAMIGGRRRDMGLGGFPDVTLAGAREAARRAREKIDDGIDPIEDRKARKSALRAETAKVITFEDAAKAYIAAHEDGWRNTKHRQQWENTLATYAFPKLAKLSVRDIEGVHVMSVLEPIWKDRTETATRLRGRIERVLGWATARGHRDGLNPARWRDHLDQQLAAPGKIAKAVHHAALPAESMASFLSDLRRAEGMGARALEFVILTAARSGEVRGAKWSEIDLIEKVWTVPGDRMKAGKEHRVPLSQPALDLLAALPKIAGTDFVFPAPRGGPLSDMTLTAVLRRMKVPATAHGFRSTFRDWAAERTNYPRDVAEMALAHTIGDKVEAAYRRGDLFAKRTRMMADWAKFIEKPVASADIVSITAARA
ncbi:site-specific integrase [Brevundimonas sp.]|uniref:tyrosine-type recombinase/integrase n=1 Tax=Brevundimonas sp. TaxID=1871086 RepID=UPI00262E1ACB|nr:site-specific integrase [Brevundimonas sp.]